MRPAKRFFVCTVSSLGLLICCGQGWKPAMGLKGPDDLTPGKGDISVTQALKSCEAFLKKIGIAVPAGAPEVGRARIGDKRTNSYIVKYNGGLSLTVKAENGAIVNFHNFGRQVLRGGESTPSISKRLNDDLKAKSYLKSLAKRLGVTDEYKLVEFTSHLVVDRRTEGSTGFPYIRADYEVTPFGYRMRIALDAMSVLVDPVDGMVLFYGKVGSWPYSIESHEAKVDFKQAKALALPMVEKYTLGKWRSTDGMYRGTTPPPGKPSFLGYVVPNGKFGSPEYREFRPYRLRLAWVLCYPRGEEVWIDAADGKVLGGVYYEKGMGR
jgi:hypothetical protein